ncbi:MAG: carbohydrate kinase family protein [Planctomycetota bacterium]|jgi:fructokinase
MAKEDDFVLVGLGEILWDLLAQGKQLGGAPANFAYHAQALGGKGVVVSCIGDDEAGREIINQLKQLKLDPDYIAVDKKHPTGTVSVELDENGKPDYIIHTNVAWDFIPWSSNLSELAQKVDAVCYGSLCQRREVSRDTIRNFLETTRQDCIRVFDINIRQSYYNEEIVRTMLKVSNVLKLNDEELPLLASLLGISGDEQEILSKLTEEFDLRLIALTKGSKGSLLYTAEGQSTHEGYPAQIADTVGAGDSFTAVIALGLLRGEDLDKINDQANKVASFVCSQNGATPTLPEKLISKE